MSSVISTVITSGSIDLKCQMVSELINKHNDGKIFKAVNVKKDGTLRQYNARKGVSAHLKGGVSTTSHKSNLVTIYDMGLASKIGAEAIETDGAPYRSFNSETCVLLEFKRDGVSYSYIFVDQWSSSPTTENAMNTAKVCIEAAQHVIKESLK